MAQQTAFLNSDAPNFNKDFHHTMVLNYLLNNAGVLFSDLVSKTEFVLGDGQISSGSAIVKCTRTSGSFSGEEILATFKSTATEPIDTTGDKKIFIEIPEGFVNNSTTITEALTTGLNLNVGSLVSASAYPTHSNYLPLWEVTGGDRAGALDVRPVIRKFGKKDSLVYFDDSGVENNIDLTSASINKYLMSNGPSNAPTFEDVSVGLEVPKTIVRAIAGENLTRGDALYREQRGQYYDSNSELKIGDQAINEKRSFKIIGNGETITELKLKLRKEGGPSDDFDIRLETDASGTPSGSLADVNATASIAPGAIGTSFHEETGTFSGSFTLTDGVIYHIVFERGGAINGTNYYVMGVEEKRCRAFTQNRYNGSTRSVQNGYRPYIELAGAYAMLRCKTDPSYQESSDFCGFAQQNTTIGEEFVQDTLGVTNIFSGLLLKKYYLANTPGEIIDTDFTQEVLVMVGEGISSTELRIRDNFSNKNKVVTVGVGQESDYTTISQAVKDEAKYIVLVSNITETVEENLYGVTIRSYYSSGTITFEGELINCTIEGGFNINVDFGVSITNSTFSLLNSITNTNTTASYVGDGTTFIECLSITYSGTGSKSLGDSRFINCGNVAITSTDNNLIDIEGRSSIGTLFTLNSSGTIRIRDFNECEISVGSSNTSFSIGNMTNCKMDVAVASYEIDLNWADTKIIGNHFEGSGTYSSQDCVVKGSSSNDRVMFCNNTITSSLKFEDIDRGMLCNNMAESLIASTGCSNVTEANNSGDYA